MNNNITLAAKMQKFENEKMEDIIRHRYITDELDA